MKKNNSAQMYILEAVSATIIILFAFLFVYMASTPQGTVVSISSTTQLRILGSDILTAIYEDNPSDGTYSNLLAEYVFEDGNSDFSSKVQNFTIFLNKSFPKGIMYNVWVYNPHNDSRVLYYPHNELISVGSVARTHKFVCHQGFVRDVQLEMWYI